MNCTNGSERKKRQVKNNAEVNWNTKYKSETYKYTIKTIAKIMSVCVTDNFEYVAFFLIR